MEKTRFLILQNKIEKQLFSVEERASGDLLIGVTPPKTARINGQNVDKPKSRKISIHLSPLSNPAVYTITHEIGFNLRGSHKGYAVVRRHADQPFIWPIYCQSFGTHEAKFIHRRKTDKLRNLIAYDSKIDTLLVAVFLTEPFYSIPESHGLSVTIQRYSSFNLNIVTAFADVKSSRSTCDIFNYTSLPKDGNFLAKIGGTTAANTFSIFGLEQYLLDIFMRLARISLQRSFPLIITPPMHHIQIRRFGRYPNGISLSEACYGEHNIANAARHDPFLRMDPSDARNQTLFATRSEPTPYLLDISTP